MRVYVLDSGRRGLKRLIIGGLHGREGRIIKPILERLILYGRPQGGVLIVVPSLCNKSRYVSTLSEKYFETKEGRKLLSLLEHYRPDVYIEVHCYAKKAYRSLTSPTRMTRKGVPKLVELEKGVLIGSSPPHLLLKNLFKFGMTVEVPCRDSDSHEALLTLLKTVRDQDTIEGLLNQLATLYPREFHEAITLHEHYRKRIIGAMGTKGRDGHQQSNYDGYDEC